MLPDRIEQLIAESQWEEAIKELRRHIVENPDDDNAMYEYGRLQWKLGDRARALASYRRAVAVNPDSPARHALEIADDIFAFYNKDLYNP